ncbi:hypothetical protein BJV74DRAFT_862018 [Russula compacta]|nr:hypothetical protein BJV74DRAFT_862018 [Russula compacta]
MSHPSWFLRGSPTGTLVLANYCVTSEAYMPPRATNLRVIETLEATHILARHLEIDVHPLDRINSVRGCRSLRWRTGGGTRGSIRLRERSIEHIEKPRPARS